MVNRNQDFIQQVSVLAKKDEGLWDEGCRMKKMDVEKWDGKNKREHLKERVMSWSS